MNGLSLLLLLLAGGALWLAFRPALRSLTEKLDPRLAGGAAAAMLFALAVGFFLFRLAPIGVVFLVLGAGALGGALRRPDPALQEEAQARGGRASAPRAPGAGMSRKEALAVLGLDEDPAPDAVEAAHRKMIRHAHPDGGGSDYLAAKVNEARDVLLAERRLG